MEKLVKYHSNAISKIQSMETSTRGLIQFSLRINCEDIRENFLELVVMADNFMNILNIDELYTAKGRVLCM
jgi:hypothetical protein